MIRNSLLCAVAAAALGCSTQHQIPLGSPPDGPIDVGGRTCLQSFTACGGDLTGTWKLSQFCGTQNLLASTCTTATTTTTFTGSETVTFGAGSFTQSKMETLAYTTDAASCVGGSGAATCDAIQQQNTLQTCAPGAAGPCTCTQTIPVTNESTYAYTVSGSVVTFSQNMADVYASEFCVQGDALFTALPGFSTFSMYVRQ